MRRSAAILAVFAVGVLIAGCSGQTEPADQITDTTARLKATVACNAGEQLEVWWRWRQTTGQEIDHAWNDTGHIFQTCPNTLSGLVISRTLRNLEPRKNYQFLICDDPHVFGNSTPMCADAFGKVVASYADNKFPNNAVELFHTGPNPSVRIYSPAFTATADPDPMDVQMARRVCDGSSCFESGLTTLPGGTWGFSGGAIDPWLIAAWHYWGSPSWCRPEAVNLQLADYGPTGWVGYSSWPGCGGGQFNTERWIQLNMYYSSGTFAWYPTATWAEKWCATVVHEYGHVLGLWFSDCLSDPYHDCHDPTNIMNVSNNQQKPIPGPCVGIG